MTGIHPTLGRTLGEVTLTLTLCNGVWHGELTEQDDAIWKSRGESTRAAVEKSAGEFAGYARTVVREL